MALDAGDLTELKKLRHLCFGDDDADLAALAKTRNAWAEISVRHSRKTTIGKPQQLLVQRELRRQQEDEPQLEAFEEMSDEDTTANKELV